MPNQGSTTGNKNINTVDFMIDFNFPTEFADSTGKIWVNFGAFPKDIDFEECLYHIIRAINTETICVTAINEQKQNKYWPCGIDCIPNILSNKILYYYCGLRGCTYKYFKSAIKSQNLINVVK